MTEVHDSSGQVVHDDTGASVTDENGSLVAVYDARTALFFAVEIDTFQPGGSGALDVLRVSDRGYRTLPGDPLGVVPYPAFLDSAFEIDRKLSLDPGQVSSRSDGAIRITNTGRLLDAFTVPRNVDSRRVRVLVGQKTYDPNRGVYVDPPYASLRPFFLGLAGSWMVGEDEITIPLRDTSYWTQRAAQTKLYGGTGKMDGGPTLVGKPIPMARGGTADSPIREVSPVQVDAVNQIWQWTDGPGTVVGLYEGGSAFKGAGDVADLYSGTTPPGKFRTCNAKGLFQLGSTPVGTITADVTGAFAVGGAVSTASLLAFYLLTETLGVPVDFVDEGAFRQVDGWNPYVAGFYVSDQTPGITLVQGLMASIGGRMVSNRAGQLRPYLIRSTLFGSSPDLALNPTNTVSVEPIALPTTLDPPPYRWQFGYAHHYTVQSSGLNAAVAQDATRKEYLAAADRYAIWTDAGISGAWVRPNDPAPVATMLLRQADAARVASDTGVLWRDRPGYFNVIVPLDVAAGLDIGSVVRVTWPLSSLAAGALGQIVGEQVRSYDNEVTFQVLIIHSAGDFSPTAFDGSFSGGIS